MAVASKTDFIDNDIKKEVLVDNDNKKYNRHDAIRSFLQDFFNDWKRDDLSTNIVRCCRGYEDITPNRYSIDITSLNFTSVMFEESLGKVCKELFRYKYRLEYVIVLLLFVIDLDKHLQHKIWYTTERVIDILTMELVNTPFPLFFENIIDIEETKNHSSFLMAMPALFMAYFLCT